MAHGTLAGPTARPLPSLLAAELGANATQKIEMSDLMFAAKEEDTKTEGDLANVVSQWFL